MAELINLRQFKKRKARQEDADRAAENRAKFGRAKAEKKAADVEADKRRRDLDGKKRED
ncbi:MAG: DUF4169 family protein [Euryhalocaulis sp.]|uniref:DUF4169 family protein n=1 Tax=Euryhalocaulis sp. TaxID=2744307 RepID=UPI0017C69762|nr:DUF4169 family protein [Euryhalocaulis sp.]MBA4802631.1 DUF4169 family protein [Euryhalocaulis sp.]